MKYNLAVNPAKQSYFSHIRHNTHNPLILNILDLLMFRNQIFNKTFPTEWERFLISSKILEIKIIVALMLSCFELISSQTFIKTVSDINST